MVMKQLFCKYKKIRGLTADFFSCNKSPGYNFVLNNIRLCSSRVHTNISDKSSKKDNSNYFHDDADGETFRYLLRNSKLINMGDPDRKVVLGTIFHVIKDDLYIDFDWKFYVVCPRPNKEQHLYVRGTKVYIRIKELELSSRFLGSERDLTILEADGTIVGLESSPVKKLEE